MKSESVLDAEKIIDLLINLVPHTKVAHHEPGRITLKLLLPGLGVVQNDNFEGLVDAIPGILDTRLKLWSRSVDIDYDEELLPFDLWESLVGLKENPEGTAQVRLRLRSLLDQGIP